MEFEYGVTVTAEEVSRRGVDTVIIATGARPSTPYWMPEDLAGGSGWIVDVRDVLSGRVHPEGNVVVIDEIGFHHATSVAELLADRGCDVEIITPGMVVGQDLGITLDMENWWIRAGFKGIVQTTNSGVMGIEGHTVQLQHHPTGTQISREPDWLVLALPADPVDELYFELKGLGVDVYRAGDAVAPRRAHSAVIEGERVGAAVASADRVLADR